MPADVKHVILHLRHGVPGKRTALQAKNGCRKVERISGLPLSPSAVLQNKSFIIRCQRICRIYYCWWLYLKNNIHAGCREQSALPVLSQCLPEDCLFPRSILRRVEAHRRAEFPCSLRRFCMAPLYGADTFDKTGSYRLPSVKPFRSGLFRSCDSFSLPAPHPSLEVSEIPVFIKGSFALARQANGSPGSGRAALRMADEPFHNGAANAFLWYSGSTATSWIY